MHRSFSQKILTFGAIIAGLWLGIRYFLPVGLPFLLALFLALAAENGVSWLHEKLHLPRAAASALGVSGLCLGLLTVMVLSASLLMRQVPRLTAFLPELEAAVNSGRQQLQAWLLSVTQSLPGSVGTLLTDWTEKLFSGSQLSEPLLRQVPQFLTGLVGKMSSGAFGLITALIASFMLSARLPQWKQWLQKRLPPELTDRYQTAAAGFRKALGGWLLAQGKLAAVTFGILSIGFFLLRISRPLLWAGLITLVDAFPILGVGTVLLPWALVCLVQGETARGIGLLSIYAVAWLLRSVLEPKLVGKGLGLDPLLTLAAIYAGFRLWGIGGMLLAPMGAMVAGQIWKAWK